MVSVPAYLFDWQYEDTDCCPPLLWWSVSFPLTIWYQIIRTLVGAGLKDKTSLRRPLASLFPSHITHVPENVKTFEPESNSVTLTSGRKLDYEFLVVATGIQINWGAIQGLPQALADPTSGVSSIYSYDTCDKTWKDIEALRHGKAIFTQPAGVVKCAGGQYIEINWIL